MYYLLGWSFLVQKRGLLGHLISRSLATLCRDSTRIWSTPTPPPMAWQSLVGQGLRWTSGRPIAETSTSQHSPETDVHGPGGIRTRNRSMRTAAVRHLRRRGHWDWQEHCQQNLADRRGTEVKGRVLRGVMKLSERQQILIWKLFFLSFFLSFLVWPFLPTTWVLISP